MAQKRATPTPADKPSLRPYQAIQLLRIQHDKGMKLLENRPITSSAEQTWETVTRDVLTQAFGANSPNVDSVMGIGRYDFFGGGGTEQEWEEQRAKNMITRLEIITGLIEL